MPNAELLFRDTFETSRSVSLKPKVITECKLVYYLRWCVKVGIIET